MIQRTDGLTIMELMIVMVIVSLLLATAVPALHHWLADQRLRAAALSLQSGLMYARSEAVMRGVAIIACPGTPETGCSTPGQWQQGWVIFADVNADRIRQSEEPLLRTQSRTESVTITSSAARGKLRFLPNGTAPGSNATVHICDQRGTPEGRRITVSNSGRIRQTGPGEGPGQLC